MIKIKTLTGGEQIFKEDHYEYLNLEQRVEQFLQENKITECNIQYSTCYDSETMYRGAGSSPQFIQSVLIAWEAGNAENKD